MSVRSGGQLVVDSLCSEGVRKVFTVPGESFLPVLDALYDQAGAIDVVSARHEGGAGFMADGYSKASGEVSVCMVTRGVGAANLSIALHTARQDSTPMVAFVGQVPTSVNYREAFQEVDLVRHFSPLVKWALEIPATERIPELLQQAFRVARSERPGPVVVGLPEDVLYGEGRPGPARPPVRPRPPRPSRDAVEAVYQSLTEAANPLVIVGREVLTSHSTSRVVELAEELELPVMTAFRRFDAFPNDHDNYVGNIALGTPDVALEPLAQADVVLALGARLDAFTTGDYRYPRPDARVIQVAGSNELAGTWGALCEPVVADVGLLVDDLLAFHRRQERPGEPGAGAVEARSFATGAADAGSFAAGAADAGSFAAGALDAGSSAAGALDARDAGAIEAVPGSRGDASRAAATRRYRRTYERLSSFDQDDSPVSGVAISGVLRSIAQRAPAETALTTDAGNFSAWVSRYYPFTRPFTHFGPTAGAMGYGLPSGIGVSLANPDRLVFALAGDGGFAMTMSELAVLEEHQLPVVALVFVNGIHGTIRMHQERQYPGRVVGTSLVNPSFEAIGKAFGVDSFRVTDNSGFDEVLGDLLARPRPALVEIMEGDERLTAWGDLTRQDHS